VAINPTAHSGKGAGVGARVVERLGRAGYAVQHVVGADARDLHNLLTRQLREDSTLVVVGGDGMVSLAVNLLAGTRRALALVPAGTGNDFARGMRYPVDDIDACIELTLVALAREPQSVDLAEVTGSHGMRMVAGVVSAGFDALVNERANRMRFPRGHSKYTIAIFRELLALRPRHYELTVDGVVSRIRAVLVSVANNSFMGGGMWVSPSSSFSDGALEVFEVGPVSRRRLVRLLPSVFKGGHVNEPEVRITGVVTARLDSPGVVAYADGERIGPLPIDVTVRPGVLRLHTLD
jgi:diacylglycerol kinase (ATP)